VTDVVGVVVGVDRRERAVPVPRRAITRLIVTLVTASLLAACSSDASPSASASARASDSPAAVATASPVAATPKPTTKPVAAWSEPVLVSTQTCGSLRGGIDAAGGSHLVASCEAGLLYASTKADGAWAETVFSVPTNRVEQDPQIGFQGKVAYFAYSRMAVAEGGCGDSGLTDIGVFYRKRTLPGGGWSDPVRIGKADDHLAQFRVDGTAIHAVVQNAGDGRFYYLLVKGTASRRFVIAGASKSPSLRIDLDGRARIAYATAGSIRIATFTGSAVSTVKVSAPNARGPILVLDGHDRAHLVWNRDSDVDDGGCVSPGNDDPAAGIYYTTNATGMWHSERLTKELGETSFQVDRSTGQVHVVTTTPSGLTYYTKAPGGAWQHEKLANRAGSPVIARDAASGRVLVLYIGFRQASDTSWPIWAISKGG
jgi:hypothetical protein